MRALTTPTANADTLYQACAEATVNDALKTRLLGYQPRVVAAAESYRAAGAIPDFHTLPRAAIATTADDELRDL